MENASDEILSLRRSLHDLVALTMLPTIGASSTPQDIAESLADVLFATCPHLDVIYILLKRPEGEHPIELVRADQQIITGEAAQQIGAAFETWLKTEHTTSIFSITDPTGDGILAAMVIPIGATAGYVLVGVRDGQALSETDRLLLGVATNQALTALQQAQLVADLRTANQLKEVAFLKEQFARERVAGLQAITAAFSQALTVDQIAVIAIDQMTSIVKAAFGVFHYLLDSESVTLRYRTGESSGEERQRYPIDPTLAVTKVLLTQQALWVEAIRESEFAHTAVDGDVQQGGMAVLPLVIHGEVLGAIEYVFTNARRFTQEDRDFMLAVSHQCAQALERARLYEAEFTARALLQVRVKLQSVIAELGQDALVHTDLSALMDKTVNLLATTLDVEYASILELIPADRCLLLKAGIGWTQGYVGKAIVSAGAESQAGYTLHAEQPVIVDDLRAETRFHGASLPFEQPAISSMSVIIEGHQRAWGVLGVHTTQRRQFTSDDVYFVQSVANTLGAALERDRLDKAQSHYAMMLRRSNDELQQFAYIVSHDLQEPLRMVTSFLQLLEMHHGTKLDGEARGFIGFAIDGAMRMKDLITALLAYSRVDRGDKAFEEFEMQQALRKALANLSLSIEESGATITCDELPRIKADLTQIAQLLQNLIGNAIKFQQGKPPTIHISAERKDSMWQFSVRDNGIGIEAKFLERIFVIFQRLHRRDEYPGTGIGLAICKKVVERHGGQIWVESVVDEGTTFYFTIPY